MGNTPKVSVIIPVYNVEKYIEKCLHSLLNQTLKEIEIITVNDCSPDNSQQIIDSYAKKDSRIVPIIHQENKMQGGARNTGLNVAKGEYISFVDSDDWIELDAYEKLYNAAKQNKADIVAFGARWIYQDGSVQQKKYLTQKIVHGGVDFVKAVIKGNFDKLCGDENLEEWPRYLVSTVIWDKLIHRDIFYENNIRFPEGYYFEDPIVAMKMGYYSKRILLYPEVFYNFFQASISSSTTRGEITRKKLYSFSRLFDHFKAFFEAEGLNDKVMYYYDFITLMGFVDYAFRNFYEFCANKSKEEVEFALDNELVKAFFNHPDFLREWLIKASVIYSPASNNEKPIKELIRLYFNIKLKGTRLYRPVRWVYRLIKGFL